MARCALDAGCEAVATARIAIARRSTGALAYVTVVPASLAGAGGAPACADHVHAKIDGLLLASLGPPQQPAREQLPPADDEQAPA